MEHFDVVIIGGGHAGTEAACASVRMGAKTALITHRFDRIGEMSCNPAIGGLGKGHLVREIDALDGVMGKLADKAAIQYRLLNRSKGPAVQGPRSQIDRSIYRKVVQEFISDYENLTVIEGEAARFRMSRDSIRSVILADETEVEAKQFVLTTGTFLGGKIFIGEERIEAGRVGDPASITLAKQLRDFDLPMGRLKTGTPPRLLSSTIDWDRVGRQEADSEPVYFSMMTNNTHLKQISCGITETNPATHEIIQSNIHRSAMYKGYIEGTGPRYCPSIEDKVTRFSDKDNHQVFLEPEGLNDPLIYPNGISTSLPRDVQLDYVRSMRGLENVEITQYGYAIEYDYIDPRALDASLKLKSLSNLYFAGQINGTTGYEEAAAQGLFAAANAVLHLRGERALDLNRTNSYIGVLVDDLITRGVTEPYRMFTSRAEYRLSIRADNADQRLTKLGFDAGLVRDARMSAFETRVLSISEITDYAQNSSLTPNQAQKLGISVKSDGRRRNLLELMAYPDVSRETLVEAFPELADFEAAALKQVEIDALYANYIERQRHDISKFEKDRALVFPAGFQFRGIQGLSNELVEKLERANPANIAEANKIEGITPAALTLLAAYLRKSGAA